MVKLTKREQECLYWAAKGKTSWEIGTILGISERTVNFHISNLIPKFSVHSRQAAIAIAISTGLLDGVDFINPNLQKTVDPANYKHHDKPTKLKIDIS